MKRERPEFSIRPGKCPRRKNESKQTPSCHALFVRVWRGSTHCCKRPEQRGSKLEHIVSRNERKPIPSHIHNACRDCDGDHSKRSFQKKNRHKREFEPGSGGP